MKQYGLLLCGVVAVSLLALGCEANKPQDDQQTSMVGMNYDTLAPAEEESYDTYEPADESYAPAAQETEAIDLGEVYVVKAKDTLYAIARAYYSGDHSKWRLIYEANRERISDPNVIYVGMKLIIPPVTTQ